MRVSLPIPSVTCPQNTSRAFHDGEADGNQTENFNQRTDFSHAFYDPEPFSEVYERLLFCGYGCCSVTVYNSGSLGLFKGSELENNELSRP